MKRFFAVLGGLLLLPAFAEVAPVYYDDFVEYTDDVIEPVNDTEEEIEVKPTAKVQKNVSQRTSANRSTSRALSSSTTAATPRSNASSRTAAASIRNAQKISRGTTSRASRSVGSTRSAQKNVVSRANRTASQKPVTARVSATNGSVMPINRSNYSNNNSYVTSISDSGESLYKSSAETARVGMASRRATTRIATAAVPVSTVITEDTISTTASNLDAIAELTEYCQAQYAACMDNYCNVLDDNQGRCSCSKNIKNYKLTETALEKATEEFQETVQKIKYLGLTADQVTALFTETEAEVEMKNQGDDKTNIRKSLDNIKDKLLINAEPGKVSSSQATSVSLNTSGLFDIDLASGFDLSGFMGSFNSDNTTSVSNQRGEQLYKTAAARCKTSVLNSCTAQGIDANIITNSYDLEIDKHCIAYERSLNDANAEMKSNVRNASTILQQARLMLAQNRNTYDLRSCVAAIDACMQDEYICGSDYELCLDPTGKYLANGVIVKGGTPGVSGGTVKNTEGLTQQNITSWTSKGMYDLYATWNYGTDKNAWGGGVSEKLGEYIDEKLTNWKDNYSETASSSDMATYLLQKIGYVDAKTDKVHGMCASVMKQCQDFTFENASKSNKKYIFDNEVVRQYLMATLTKIKLSQDSILADYAEDCRSDVTSCLSTNGYDESNTSTTASQTAVNACRADIQTCMSVTGQKPSDAMKLTLRAMADWVKTMLLVCPEYKYMNDTGEGEVSCERCATVDKYVENSNGTITKQGTIQLYAPSGSVGADSCVCPDNTTVYDDGCLER